MRINRSKINRVKYFGVRGNIIKYKQIILQHFDTDFIKKLISQYIGKESFEEDLYTLFNRLLTTTILKEIMELLEDSFDKGGKRVLNTKGEVIKLGKVINKQALLTLQSSQLEYLSNLAKELAKKVTKILSKGYEEGMSIDQIAKQIEENIDNTTESRAELIARSEIIKASALGTRQGMREAGIKKYMWLTARDKKVCALCKSYDGKTFSIDDENSPIPVQSSHPNCFSKDTEVFTDEGWKFFKELTGTEKILSMNPETQEIGWADIKNKVKSYEEKMLKFYNNYNFNILVSKNHTIWYKTNKGTLEQAKAEEMKDKYYFKIIRQAKYNSTNDQVIIGNQIFDAVNFMKFFGWYLSEGNIVHRNNEYQIKITQKDPQKVIPDLIIFKDKLRIGKEAIYINVNQEIGEYLIKLGKCYEKYIPKELKNLNKEALKSFLETYRKGDGSIRYKEYKGYKTKEILYFTSSERLASDIGELLIKVGKYPSYYLQKSKGKKAKFRNGEYIINHNLWIIRECNRETTFIKNKYGKIEEVEYNDYAFCVELNKWHILYVRRKGKCCWCGNCRCTIIAK